MDHKKVGNLIPVDGNGDPYIFEPDGVTPKLFGAEFNSGIVRGDVTGAEGTFSGTLTADAVDAVSNLNLRGGSVAVSFSSYSPGPFGYPETNNPNVTAGQLVTTLLLNTPIGDTAGGLLYVRCAYRIRNPDNDLTKWHMIHTTLVVDGVVHGHLVAGTGSSFIDSDYRRQAVATAVVGPGQHSIQIYNRSSVADGSNYAELREVTITVDYVRL